MPRKSGAKATVNQLRIIGGQWRGRKLPFPSSDGLRPTGDRIRETLFNWLGQNLSGVRALDLFAGSGALGIEALSRGAASATFVDSSREACETISNSLEILAVEKIDAKTVVYQQQARDFLGNAEKSSIDLLFLDPPFAEKLHGDIAALIHSNGVMAPGAMVYVESPIGSQLLLPNTWSELRSKTTGRVRYQLLQT